MLRLRESVKRAFWGLGRHGLDDVRCVRKNCQMCKKVIVISVTISIDKAHLRKV